MGRAAARHYSERLDRADLRRLLEGSVDLIIELDERGIVVDLSEASGLVDPGWIGKEFITLVSADSLEKAQDLTGPDMMTEPGVAGAHMRHVNLIGEKGQSLPFLLRLFRLEGAGQAVRLLVGRDLAPQARIQRQFEATQQVMIRDYEARLVRMRDSYQRDLRASSIVEAAGRIGASPLEQILAAFTQRLRRQCAQEALARSGEDYRAAANLLGVTEAELDSILSAPVPE